MNEKTKNRLYYGDNLHVLRDHVPAESVDLIYLDPPFNSKRDYNLLFKTPKGMESDAQITAFEDSWHWAQQAEDEFKEIVNPSAELRRLRGSNTDVADLMQALRSFLKENDMLAYLTMMCNRLLELHRVLKPTGSLYLHCDPTASHYLKLVLDGVFGKENYRSEINWKRSSAHNDAKQGRKQYGNIRDTIFFYTKSAGEWKWNWLFTNYDISYIEDFYKYTDETSGRRYRMGDLTAAKTGGDTRYEWRVKSKNGRNWEADLDEEWKTPHPSVEYKGLLPYGKRIWAYSRDNMLSMEREGRIVYAGSGMPNYKRYLDEMPGVPLQNNWEDIRPASGDEFMGYPTQKPLALLERIVSASSNKGDVVLDPFCGCGTAVHAAEKLGRRWIGIDITHLSVSLIEKRMKNAFPYLDAGVGAKAKAPPPQPSPAGGGSKANSAEGGSRANSAGGGSKGDPAVGRSKEESAGNQNKNATETPPPSGGRLGGGQADTAKSLPSQEHIGFEVIGTPQDFDAAKDLADRDKYQFQFWACTLVNAQPYKGGKKGADGGVDGIIYAEVGKSKTEKIVVSVKAGANISNGMIRDLKGAMEREKAIMGLFVTLTSPTKPMVTEAVAAGHYQSPHHGDFPKIQILTIEGLLSGMERAKYPDMAQGEQTFKAAKTEKGKAKAGQGGLFE